MSNCIKAPKASIIATITPMPAIIASPPCPIPLTGTFERIAIAAVIAIRTMDSDSAIGSNDSGFGIVDNCQSSAPIAATASVSMAIVPSDFPAKLDAAIIRERHTMMESIAIIAGVKSSAGIPEIATTIIVKAAMQAVKAIIVFSLPVACFDTAIKLPNITLIAVMTPIACQH